MKKLEGKVALVTGGTSGIGLATAKLFVSEGAKVVIAGRRSTVLEAALKEIGVGATGVQADAGKLADLDRLYAEIKQKFGRPLWEGDRLDNQTLLIHADDGLGDTLQLIRYLPLVRASRFAAATPCGEA